MHGAGYEGLPVQRGLWWRMHHQDAPLSPGQAASKTTAALYKDCAGLRGYSAFANPHQLRDYLQDLTWVGSAEVGWDERTVLAFHGKEVGRGEDGEPLVVPHWDQSCCGQTVHAQMPWEEFTARLEHTLLPTSPWDAAKGRHVSPFYWQERHERRHPAESCRPAGRGRRAGRDLEPGG
jgi:hypothetical protein